MCISRGEQIGRGSFASVSKAAIIARNDTSCSDLPSLIAVKSCDASFSGSLEEEKRILDRIGVCPQVVRCFGNDFSVEDGRKFCNLLLELASDGSLADQLERRHGGGLAECDVRRHTRAILEGLSVIHSKGFVHCDIKPQNILLFNDGTAKISDFGLSKEKDTKLWKCELRGTPLYIAPESVNGNEYEPPCDVWALGCVVAEMATGKTAWNHVSGSNVWMLLMRIAGDEEIPDIPDELSEEGRDFLSKCFVKDPRKRWTAQMLLSHPFVARCDHNDAVLWKKDAAGANEFSKAEAAPSPRCPFSFCELVSISEPHSLVSDGECSLADRIQQLVTDETFGWSSSDSWMSVV